MSQQTKVFFDHRSGTAYYLAFDLLLACAPIENGHVDTAQSRVAGSTPDPPELAARHSRRGLSPTTS